MAQINAAYFTPNAAGMTPARLDLQTINNLYMKWGAATVDIEAGTTPSGEPLTAGQKLNIRNQYTAYYNAVTAWLAGLPTP